MSQSTDAPDRRQVLSQALRALGEMEAKIAHLEQAKTEPIAIIGLGCRFPGGANDPEEFWTFLRTGRDAVTEMPGDRWNVANLYDPDPDAPGKMCVRRGGFLSTVDLFDPQFFGISPREAASLDPQQRLVLEVSSEALEHAGQSSARLEGTRTGVFLGLGSTDYSQIHAESQDLTQIDAYTGTGNHLCFAAGRLSYFLGAQGPSLIVDTACSSALVAVHLACQSLRLGESDLALAGGAHVMLSPALWVFLSKAKALAPDGRCRAFDAAANGFVRGEGCGVVVLKRLSDARRQSDRILAVIRGSAVNQDGPSSGLTVPSGTAQQALIREALTTARVEPTEIDFVEAHGTGTSLGDPIEARALGAVFGPGRPADRPLLVGSVKTNIGHLEAAAGIAGLIKTTLALQHGEIPPNLHFTQLNPHILADRVPIQVPTAPTPWPRTGTPRRAGVSSFGLSGTNAHVILEEAPPPAPAPAVCERPQHLLALSAKTEPALRALAGRYAAHLAGHPDEPLADVCFTANVGRSHFAERAALVADDAKAARDQLDALAQGIEAPGMFRGQRRAGASPKVAFLFTGQGAQYVGMGKELYETAPAFRAALDRCAALFDPHLNRPLLSVIFPGDGGASPLDETGYTQPALFALEYALAECWRAWGIQPAAVLGHSVGEYAAACVAGAISLPDACTLVAVRGRLMQALPGGGAMAAVFADEESVRAALRPVADRVAIAGLNGPQHTVISGDEESVERLCAAFTIQGVTSKRLVVSHAFHSPLLDPMLEALEAAARGVQTARPDIPLVSNLTGQFLDYPPDPAYWRRHAREPVRFLPSMCCLQQKGIDVYLEIGPHPVLIAMGRQCLPSDVGMWCPSLRRGREGWQQMLESLGAMYAAGTAVDWAEFDRAYPRRRVSLPTYPFQRERYPVISTGRDRSAPADVVREPVVHPLLGRRLHTPLAEVLFEAQVRTDAPALLGDHRMSGVAVFPATAYVEMARAAVAAAWGWEDAIIEELAFEEALVLSDDGARTIHTVLTPDGAEQAGVRVFSRSDTDGDTIRWRLHATGVVRRRGGDGDPPILATPALDTLRHDCREVTEGDAYYLELRKRGLDFGPRFQRVSRVWRRPGVGLGRIEAAALGGEADSYRLHPALLDACLHLLVAAWADGAEGTYLPVRIESIWLSERSREAVWSHATLRSAGGAAGDLQIGDILLLDAAEQVVGQIRGLTAKRIDSNAILRASGAGRDWLYELQWRTQALPEAGAPTGESDGPGSWLVLADRGGVGADLATLLVRAGGSCVRVFPGDAFAADGQGAVQVRIDQPDDFRCALAKNEEDGKAACRGVVDLWGLDAEMREDMGEEQVEQAQALACGGLVSALQATAGRERPPRLWVVTRGAQAVGTGRPSVAQSPVWGLCRTLTLEHPEFSPVCVDLDPAGKTGDAEILWREMRSGTGEDQVAFRQGTRYVARLARVPRETRRADVAGGCEAQPLRLDVVERGTLDQLRVQAVSRRPPGSGEIEVRVRATGLNFRDVLNVLGLYPGEPGPPGNECAGIVVAVGEGVHTPRVGDAIVALAPASFATYVTTRADLAVPKPAALSYEEAAAVPIAYLTADYALNHLARMAAGDRVLIHAAAGGVGLAAVALAQRAGAEVFATAGSEEKRAFLRGLGVSHVMDSRSVEFAAELMERTGGRGVTILLNSLSGELIPRSLSTLAPQGRFVEIGRRGIWDATQVAAARPDVSYWVLFMGDVFDTKPELTRAMLTSLLQSCAEGSIGRLPQRVFPFTQAVDAFRTMAQARHIGKIVLTQTDAPPAATPMDRPIHAEASYLITGGLGGLGLRVAEWMAASGARHLVLLGRRHPAQPATDAIRRLVEQRVEVRVVQADVSRSVEMEPVLADIARAMPPLRGVVHAAGVLEDGALLRQDWERFRAVLAPKATGAWVLHRLTRGLPLDFFVLFSSAASLIGSRGQGSYAAANAFLDGLAHNRRADGLPATSINWGAWAEIGMAARLEARRPSGSAQRGLGAIPPSRGVEILERILREGFIRVGVLPIDWPTFRRQWEAGTVPPLWRDIVGDVTTSVGPQRGVAAAAGLAERLARTPVERQRSVVLNHVSDQVKKVLGLGAGQIIDSEQGLRDVGMDSLMSVELRNALQASLGRPLPSTLAFDHPTVASLTDYLADKVLGLMPPEPGIESEDRACATAEVAGLSDAEAEALLEEELARQRTRQP